MHEYAPTTNGERDTPTPTGREQSDQIVHREQDRAALTDNHRDGVHDRRERASAGDTSRRRVASSSEPGHRGSHDSGTTAHPLVRSAPPATATRTSSDAAAVPSALERSGAARSTSRDRGIREQVRECGREQPREWDGSWTVGKLPNAAIFCARRWRGAHRQRSPRPPGCSERVP
jgi:hypothetical protein